MKVNFYVPRLQHNVYTIQLGIKRALFVLSDKLPTSMIVHNQQWNNDLHLFLVTLTIFHLVHFQYTSIGGHAILQIAFQNAVLALIHQKQDKVYKVSETVSERKAFGVDNAEFHHS